ncbi:MAG: bifunctional (p)ppGpp synthetase/guanosine-3',5'-bis(diphosphate) 3'-pyrophosphohydrolase [Dehalococcoidia bacterium]|nr:MAG: bifunctional (p)ppGpp synthetase/guanosine-3',5'-bis(diphosphate) 3'-pyrophosphohydrolase [Dehalococcoidia bacterium]
MTPFSLLLEKAGQYLPSEKLALVEGAYHFALKAHKGQVRKSGEPYLEHPLQVALTLTELQLDAGSLAAALLHDVTEDCSIPISQIEDKFGAEVAKLVDGTTKLGRLSLQVPSGTVRRGGIATRQQAESLRKMLVAMAEDLRVVFIKLADRLHNMHTLDALSAERRRNISRETLEIYAPLAHRLGIWELKWQLEDLAFRYLEPRKYNRLVNLVATRRTERENFIENIIEILRKEFDKVKLKAEISGRPKHLYSIYHKMERYTAQGKHFDDIYDLLALRVLVDTIPDCYNAVGIVHSLWHPLPGTFDDYIANPKPNGYQALHTAVMCMGTTPLEVQIRTRDMHRIAEYGVAAHWRYKGGDKEDIHFEERVGWLRQLIDWHRELSGTEEFLESVKTDIFMDQVFVFTPRGEIKDLPKGATPLDFAYRIHTELGHRCIGAKVNGRMVPLDYQLHNGDVVEILTTKREKGPTRDWLNPHLGYIKTSHAKEKIRQWFKKQERTENIEHGRELLEKELKQLGLKFSNREKLAELFKYSNVDDFMAAIGYGGISVHHIALKLATQQEQPRPIVDMAPPKPPTSTVQVLGVGDLLTNLAGCCHPVPGDNIVGYVTRSRGITVHRRDCYNVVNEEEKERLIKVEWGKPDSQYPVSIQVEAFDRVGLVRDVSTVIAEEKVNIASMNVVEHSDRTTTLYLTLETRGLAQLSRLLTRIGGIRGVSSVFRVGDDATVKQQPPA